MMQGTVVDQGDGTYVVSYDVTRSGTNYVWASLAAAGGLQATYYTSSTAADYLSDNAIYGAVAEKRIVQTDTTVGAQSGRKMRLPALMITRCWYALASSS